MAREGQELKAHMLMWWDGRGVAGKGLVGVAQNTVVEVNGGEGFSVREW